MRCPYTVSARLFRACAEWNTDNGYDTTSIKNVFSQFNISDLVRVGAGECCDAFVRSDALCARRRNWPEVPGYGLRCAGKVGALAALGGRVEIGGPEGSTLR